MSAERHESRSEWQEKWARDDFAPGWRIRSVPAELREAVESGWFQAGARVLDVGCGSGEIAAWLAGEGYDVTGIDFAEAAIDRARAAYPEHERLRFEVADVSERAPAGPFEALVDRGCLHVIPLDLRPGYARSLAAAAAPDARLLVLYRVADDVAKEDVLRQLGALLEPEFELVRTADTVLGRPHGQEARSGIALWLTRRAAQP